MNLSNNTMMLILGDQVHGHLEAKKALITMVNRSILRAHQRYAKGYIEEQLIRPLKVLLIGASGCGKSFLVHCLGRAYADIPIVKLDATEFNPEGASGGIKASKVKDIIESEARIKMMEYPHIYMSIQHAVDRTIVFIDEFDKLGDRYEGGSSGKWNKDVQANFLTLFDNKDEFAGVSFVFAGAFDDITQEQKQRNGIGFGDVKKDPEGSKDLIDTKIVKAGLIPEIVGRINYIVEMDKFDADSMLDILYEKTWPKKMEDLDALGVENYELTDEDALQICIDAVKSGQGVRYLQRQLDKMFLDAEFHTDVRTAINRDYLKLGNDSEALE